MQAGVGLLSVRSRWLWFFVSLGVALVLDLVSKYWVFAYPPAHEPSLQVIDRLRILHHHWQSVEIVRPALNTGVAWSMFDNKPGFVVALTLVLLPILLAVYIFGYRKSARRLEHFGFGTILGGAFGNAWDRVWSLSPTTDFPGVRDFIHVDLQIIGIDYIWPTFNIADSAIFIGFAALVLSSFYKDKPVEVPHGLSAEGGEVNASAKSTNQEH